MLVREVMTPNPLTVRPESDYLAAIALMRARKARRLPVIDEDGQLVGLVSLNELLAIRVGEPGPQAIMGSGTLVRVHEVMKREVITIPPDYPLEEAAGLMVQHKIGCLLVVEDGRVIGILTDTDIFMQFVKILGGGSPTIRLTVQVDNRPGQAAALTGCIAGIGGNILSIASYPASTPERTNFTLRVEAVTRDALEAAVAALPGAEVRHIWQSTQT